MDTISLKITNTEDIFKGLLNILTLAERLITLNYSADGTFTRLMTWERSIGYLNEFSIILFGNGQNNHSHNFFLHTFTTHGLVISLILITPVLFWLYQTVHNLGVFNKYSILLYAIVAIDWNFNTNIYQPYYSIMFAFFLVSSSVFAARGQNEK